MAKKQSVQTTMLKAGARKVVNQQVRSRLGGDTLITALALAAISFFIRKKI